MQPATLCGGRYQVLGVLGHGGMGTVFHAFDCVRGVECACKQMRPPCGRGAQEHVAQFRDEARILASLAHPAVPRVFDEFEEEGAFYLVMERVPGLSLRERVEVRGLPRQSLAIHWLERILEVLEYLHARNPPVLFRDVSPDNVMVSEEDSGRCESFRGGDAPTGIADSADVSCDATSWPAAGSLHLVDFGLARHFVADERTRPLLRGWGSPGFAAPELYVGVLRSPADDGGGRVEEGAPREPGTFAGRSPDAGASPGGSGPASDLYGVAAIAHWLFVGEPPPEAVSRFVQPHDAAMRALLSRRVRASLAAWVMRGLHLDPAARFASAAEMRLALMRAAFGVDERALAGAVGPEGGSDEPVRRAAETTPLRPLPSLHCDAALGNLGPGDGGPGVRRADGNLFHASGHGKGGRDWVGLLETLRARLEEHGWVIELHPPEPFALVFGRRLDLRLFWGYCWHESCLDEDAVHRAGVLARQAALRRKSLLPQVMFFVIGGDTVRNVEAVAAAARESSNPSAGLRAIILLPVDLWRGRAVDAHVPRRCFNTNDPADFLLNLRIAVGGGTAPL